MHIPKYAAANRHRAVAILLLLLIWCLYLLDGNALLPAVPAIYLSGAEKPSYVREHFIAASSIVEVPSFDAAPIRKLCSAATWYPDLVLHCTEARGGLHNVRQQIITCVRFSIAFGAALSIPTIRRRQETKSEDVLHEYADEASDLDYLFEHDTFVERLRESCPQMTVYQHTPEDLAAVAKLEKLQSPDLGDINTAPERWLAEQNISPGVSGMIDFSIAAGLYEICHDGPSLADSIGQVLMYRFDARALASAVLYELSIQHNLDIYPSKAIEDSTFLGIHLRTAPDATRSGWLSYEDQSAAYQHFASLYALPVIYVASGNLTSIGLFSGLVAPTPVVTKYTLLASRPDELALLNSLSWDQQAEVDYLVLLRASRYLGMTDSNFSWAVAVARRALSKAGTCGGPAGNGIVGFRVANGVGDAGVAYEDERNVIVGGPCRFRFETRAWP